MPLPVKSICIYWVDPKNAFRKKLRGCVKKDLYLRHLCKTYVIQIGGHFHDRLVEIISS